jgi:hypothetical protein
MDSISMWAVRIAQDVVPDEIDQAPFVIERFVKGGKARKALLQPIKGGVLGGFGAEALPSLLPWILHAITVAAPFLYGVLASGAINHTIELVKETNAALQTRKNKQQDLSQQQKSLISPSLTQTDHSYLLLRQCIDTISSILKASGRSSEECEHITYAILLLLLEDPINAEEFIRTITEKK